MLKKIAFILIFCLIGILSFLFFIFQNKNKIPTLASIQPINAPILTLPNTLNWQLTDLPEKQKQQLYKDSLVNTHRKNLPSFISVESCEPKSTSIDYLNYKLKNNRENTNPSFLPSCGFIKAKIPLP